MNSKLKVIKIPKRLRIQISQAISLTKGILSPDGRGPFPSVSVNEKVMEVVPPIPTDSTLFFKKKKYLYFFLPIRYLLLIENTP